jgi:hypothetical protein
MQPEMESLGSYNNIDTVRFSLMAKANCYLAWSLDKLVLRDLGGLESRLRFSDFQPMKANGPRPTHPRRKLV